MAKKLAIALCALLLSGCWGPGWTAADLARVNARVQDCEHFGGVSFIHIEDSKKTVIYCKDDAKLTVDTPGGTEP